MEKVKKKCTFESERHLEMKCFRLTCLLVLCMGVGSSLTAQCISRQVLTFTGSVVVAGNYHVSQTAGEAAVRVFSRDDYDLTQGFQQPPLRIRLPETPDGPSVLLYPNPVTDILKLQICPGDKSGFILEVYTLSGRKILRKQLHTAGLKVGYEQVDVSGLPAATYIVRIYSIDGNIDRRFKVEKM